MDGEGDDEGQWWCCPSSRNRTIKELLFIGTYGQDQGWDRLHALMTFCEEVEKSDTIEVDGTKNEAIPMRIK